MPDEAPIKQKRLTLKDALRAAAFLLLIVVSIYLIHVAAGATASIDPWILKSKMELARQELDRQVDAARKKLDVEREQLIPKSAAALAMIRGQIDQLHLHAADADKKLADLQAQVASTSHLDPGPAPESAGSSVKQRAEYALHYAEWKAKRKAYDLAKSKLDQALQYARNQAADEDDLIRKEAVLQQSATALEQKLSADKELLAIAAAAADARFQQQRQWILAQISRYDSQIQTAKGALKAMHYTTVILTKVVVPLLYVLLVVITALWLKRNVSSLLPPRPRTRAGSHL